jgi:putative ABC transport system substrate-binding protein
LSIKAAPAGWYFATKVSPNDIASVMRSYGYRRDECQARFATVRRTLRSARIVVCGEMAMSGMLARIVVALAVVASAGAVADAVAAQQTRVARLGWLEVCGPGPQRGHFQIFRARLAQLGYVEGRNLVIEQRFADCHYDRMPGLAMELVRVPVDVLFTIGTRATRIVAATVKTTPVVTYSCDPFEHVMQLARPGGNVTGVTCMTTEMMPKRLELLKELLPGARKVTLLQDPEAATTAFETTKSVAARLGVQLKAAAVDAGEDLEAELAVVAKDGPDALMVYPDMVLSSHPRPSQLGDFALKARLPTMHAFRFYVDAGGLISYGATPVEVYTIAAEQVAKVLGGTLPGELPLRRATRFELVINNRTAKALGLTIPQSLLQRADHVIE